MAPSRGVPAETEADDPSIRVAWNLHRNRRLDQPLLRLCLRHANGLVRQSKHIAEGVGDDSCPWIYISMARLRSACRLLLPFGR